MFLLMLAFAVFAWGLHYKLSLYRSEATQRQSVAKLLSQKERPFAGKEMERLLRHGLPVAVNTRRASAATVADLPTNVDPAPDGYAGSVEPQANPAAEPFRHPITFVPRGPPTTV
jgi:hypothetical protein